MLVAAPELVKMHEDVVEYGVVIHTTIMAVHEQRGERALSGGALSSIRADLLGLHRSVAALCSDGWAFAATPILRTMIELMLSTAVIVEDVKQAEYRGFKYTHQFLKANLNNAQFPEDQRRFMRSQIQDGIAALPQDLRETAKRHVYSEKLGPYWYSPEYARPSDVVDKLCPPEVVQLYALYSGGAHGGYLGLRLLKDEPDLIHPNPRPDKRSQDMALVASVRFSLEVIRACDRFETGGVNDEMSAQMFDRFYGLKELWGSA